MASKYSLLVLPLFPDFPVEAAAGRTMRLLAVTTRSNSRRRCGEQNRTTVISVFAIRSYLCWR